MLLFIIEFLVLLLAFILIHIIYNKNYNPYKNMRKALANDILHMDYTINRILPDDKGFWSLKFCVLRHFIVTLVSSILMFYFDNSLLSNGIFWVNIIYLSPKFIIQSQRKKHIKNSLDTADLLKPALNACTVMTVYCFIAFLLFDVSYIIF